MSFGLQIIGDLHTLELQPLHEHCQKLATIHEVRYANSLPTPEKPQETPQWTPDMVIVGQNWSDEFAKRDVHFALAHWPLARWISAYGIWCESDGRNRDAWPSAIRIPVSRVAARINAELEVLAGNRQPLPWTASRDEIFAFDFPPVSTQQQPCQVAIVSPDRAYRRFLATQTGGQVSDTVVLTTAVVVIWDADPCNATTIKTLGELRRRNPNTQIIAVSNHVDASLVDDLSDQGVAHVLPKLADANELQAMIFSAMQPQLSAKAI